MQSSVIPNRYLEAHVRAYPGEFNPDGSYRRGYDPKLDPFINPLLGPAEPEPPNCPDGLYRKRSSDALRLKSRQVK